MGVEKEIGFCDIEKAELINRVLFVFICPVVLLYRIIKKLVWL